MLSLAKRADMHILKVVTYTYKKWQVFQFEKTRYFFFSFECKTLGTNH